ncbi:MAG: ABC transporter permease [Bacteroidota bacterium]|nr:ABC transporter permease [Bacteroidota bacterium]
MKLPIYIAKRYLFAKKSHNAINVISAISVAGVTVGTMALVIVLSVFNGFDSLIQKLYNTFDPDLKITIAEGKRFIPSDTVLGKLSNIKGVASWSKVVEENALLKYGEKQFIATIKGVDDNFQRINGIDTMIIDGTFQLEDKSIPYAVIGQGVAYFLQVNLKNILPIDIYLPRKDASMSIAPENAFSHEHLFPSGIFAIEQEHDGKYMIVPLKFANKLLGDSLSVTAIEVKMAKDSDPEAVQNEVEQLFGDKFNVKNRFQQKELFYKIMKYEKWAIFFILMFILIIASFNIVGSLSMLIIEKKKDIATFHSFGADRLLIRRIFLYEGMMISFFGAFAGVALGLIVCFLQLKFGFVALQGSGDFIIKAYPVSVRFWDVVVIFFTVLVIGYLAALYPVKYIVRKYLPER